MGALYRRVRPLTFEEVVGQEHVKEPLARAIREGLLAQAYLFSGPRGVGKTTTARLLAMGVGCTGREGARPCGVCEHCRMVREGHHPDVLEIDAASHNSVEDVRALQERLLLAPLLAPRKVFILDEAHMLSKSAFNALLKTLEEPPPHVLFIFATTEPERMPPTILSRTQHFRFRRLSDEEIVAKLRRILGEMGREATEEALGLIARLADGAMRDAESLLDRLLLLEGPLTRERVEQALGLPPKEALFQVARLLAQDPPEVLGALEGVRALYQQGFSAKSLLSGLLEVLREELPRAFAAQGGAPPLGLSPPRLVRGMEVLDEVLWEMNRRADLMGLEVALLKLHAAWHPEPSREALFSEGEAGQRPQAARPLVQPAASHSEHRAASHGEHRAASHSEHREDFSKGQAQPASPPPGGEREGQAVEARWREFLQALKPTLRAFLREGRPHLEEETLYILFPKARAFHRQKALEKRAEYLPLALGIFGVSSVEPVLEEEKKTPDLAGLGAAPVLSELPSQGGQEGLVASPSEHRVASRSEHRVASQSEHREELAESHASTSESVPVDSPSEHRAAAPPRSGAPGSKDPLDEPRLRHLIRLFGARVLHLKPPEGGRASEPLSQDEIGGNGI
ncbi:MAG: DNA polymerase III, subunit gamma and tau [Thermus sp.]|uniref:DNA polymerase III subunit gamma/tau n=1 Tax=Thermus sp. TaxID=275 RepID=UPI003328A931